MPETDLWVYGLGEGQSLVVAADGSQWSVGADAAALLGPEGAEALAAIAARAPDLAGPRLDPGDLVLASCGDLLTTALGVDGDRSARPGVAAWPFAGYWYRMSLQIGRAERDAREAVACLRSTIADLRRAEALCGAAATAPPPPPRAPIAAPPAGVLMRWGPAAAAWEPHRLSPAPVVDAVTGILRRIVARPRESDLPPGFVHLHAELPHLGSIDARFQADALAPAGALDEAESREAAMLSGVEHYCGAYTGQGERRLASLAELDDGGERAVAIPDWEPHDPGLHELPGFPFARFERFSPIWWVSGSERGERCWVPLSLVHVGWLQSGLAPAPVFHGHNFTGMKAGRSLAEAAERACAHVAAHDAVATWWALGRGVRLRSAPVPPIVERAWGDCRLELRVLAVPSATGVPVRLVVVDDPERGIVSLGFAADRSGRRAGELAVVEALLQHVSARDLDSPQSLIRDAEALGNGAVAGLAPYDPKRRYRDAFGPGWRGMIDPMCHVQFGLDPAVAAVVRERTVPADDGPDLDEADGGPVRSRLERTGHRVVAVDATADRVKAAGFRVVRAIVPGLARIQPAAFGLDPEGGISRSAAALGWDAAAEPLPYPGW